MKIKYILLSSIVTFSTLVFPLHCNADDTLQPKIESLKAVIKQKSSLEKSVTELKAQLASSKTESTAQELKTELQGTIDRINDLENSFSELASNIGADRISTGNSKDKISWSLELENLLSPLLKEIKSLTRKPREINELQTEIESLNSEIEAVEEGYANIQKLIKAATNSPKLADSLNSLATEWSLRKESLETGKSIRIEKLKQRRAGTSTLSESISSIFQLFFKSRIRNLILALISSALVVFLLKKLNSWLTATPLFIRRRKTFEIRLFKIALSITTVVGGLLTFLTALYLFDDWVLLVLGLLALLGLAWASKEALPHFKSQIVLLMNLGTVREGERVVINGIPWQVKTLNFYTQLRNPSLEGALLRLPVNDLLTLRSRPIGSEEVWFPCHKGEFVLLSNGIFGEILSQSPETVVIKEPGGLRHYVQTTDFLALAPANLSLGFRLNCTFGIDYRHQAESTEKIPLIFKGRVTEMLKELGYGEDNVIVRAELANAGASSLDLAVIADFNGECASFYQTLQRLLQKCCVTVCNESKLVIPFTQVSLHIENDHTKLKQASSAGVN